MRKESFIDIDVGIEHVFDHLMNIEDYPRFLDHVEKVEDLGDYRYRWHINDRHGARQCEYELVDVRKNALVSWRNLDQPEDGGRVRLHAHGPSRTRVNLTLECHARGDDTERERDLKRRTQTALVCFMDYVETRLLDADDPDADAHPPAYGEAKRPPPKSDPA